MTWQKYQDIFSKFIAQRSSQSRVMAWRYCTYLPKEGRLVRLLFHQLHLRVFVAKTRASPLLVRHDKGCYYAYLHLVCTLQCCMLTYLPIHDSCYTCLGILANVFFPRSMAFAEFDIQRTLHDLLRILLGLVLCLRFTECNICDWCGTLFCWVCIILSSLCISNAGKDNYSADILCICVNVICCWFCLSGPCNHSIRRARFEKIESF